jgi:hypothetical protein
VNKTADAHSCIGDSCGRSRSPGSRLNAYNESAELSSCSNRLQLRLQKRKHGELLDERLHESNLFELHKRSLKCWSDGKINVCTMQSVVQPVGQPIVSCILYAISPTTTSEVWNIQQPPHDHFTDTLLQRAELHLMKTRAADVTMSREWRMRSARVT